MTTTTNPALAALRRQVTGRVLAGEAQPVTQIPADGRRPFRIEVPGKRTRNASSLRGAKVAMGQMIDAKGLTGRILRDGQVVLSGKGTDLGWQEMDPTYAAIIATPLRGTVDTGAGPVLHVAQCWYHPGTDPADVQADVAVPRQVHLSQDGKPVGHGWHSGPSGGDPVYVERWAPEGRAFHGWIDPVSRRVVQAG